MTDYYNEYIFNNISLSERTCENCILNEPDSVFCTRSYRKRHQKDTPCPKWDGGVQERLHV